MAAKATLIGRLPAPELDGLSPLAGRFSKEEARDEVLTVVARVKVRKVEVDWGSVDDDGEDAKTVKFEIRHLEVLGGSDERFVRSVMAQACERRTGRVELDGFEQAFGGTPNPETGEIE